MLGPPAPNLLLLTQASDARRHWAGRLQRVAGGFWQDPTESSPDRPLDVVATDIPSLAELGPALFAGAPATELADLPFAILGLGQANWADCTLSENSTDGELALAVRLLGQLGRLRRQYAESLREGKLARTLAETDPLTGLPNRRVWDARLGELAARSQPQTDLCLAIVDLDKFKAINDQHGYAAGDEVLKSAANALAGAVRRHDLVARIGGDEFGVLLSHIAEANCPSALARLLRGVAKVAGPSGGHLSASVGYTIPNPSGTTKIVELLASAEAAVRKAKGLGGATVVRA